MARTLPCIAIVEDERSVRIALERLLRSAGFRADAYASGEEFLESVALHAPDCLLLDLDLPGVSGLRVQSQLKQDGLTTPIVFITATDGGSDRAEGIKQGAVAWLRKPFDDRALLHTIRLALSTPQQPPRRDGPP